jgi:hypothetical protein
MANFNFFLYPFLCLMCQRLGIEIIVITLLANRSQQEAVLGDTDSEIMCI